MKKLFFAVVLFIVLTASCGSAPKFSDVVGKEWKLIEVHIDGKSINFDRSALVNDGFGEIFTLTFDAEMIGGTGAPNRYSAPFTPGNKQTLTVLPARATLMAPIREPEKFKEHDFFIFIQNTYEWNLVNTNLELHSKSENGAEVKLVFSL
ncbi:MAG: META domain-containing protein [Treponema sp.]|jgi:heat shock protein HslJ|nr:META domain-containing protein [Treponema sp.]